MDLDVTPEIVATELSQFRGQARRTMIACPADLIQIRVPMQTTVVSALFYIDDPFLKVRHSRYKDWLKGLLSLGSPLVMETDDVYHDFIFEERRRHDPEFRRTKLIRRRIDELECHRRFHRAVARLSATNNLPAGPIWKQPFYLLAMWNKIGLLREAACNNPFSTEWFAWLDAGGIRHRIEPGVNWPARMDLLEKDRLNCFCLSTPRAIPDQKWRSEAATFGAMVQGGTFLGRRHIIETVAREFRVIAEHCLQEGFLASEHRILDYCYSRHPELFHIMDARNTPSRRGRNEKEHWYYRHNFFDHLLSELTPSSPQDPQ